MNDEYESLLAVKPYETELIDEFHGGGLDPRDFGLSFAVTNREPEYQVFDEIYEDGELGPMDYGRLRDEGLVLVTGPAEFSEEVEKYAAELRRITDDFDVETVNPRSLGPRIHVVKGPVEAVKGLFSPSQ